MSRVDTLAVRVVTSSDFGSGTDNDVYFDIGPLGWKLSSSSNDFERGDDHTYDLDLHGLCLDTDDIVWLRLQKKGLGGVTGTTDLPDGEWRPESIHLHVNGEEFISRRVDIVLHNDITGGSRWNWVNLMPQFERTPTAQLFTRTLRMVPNNALHGSDESVAFITTNLFKNFGISGWIEGLLPSVSAVGAVLRQPAESTDGLATIDLTLEFVEINGERFFVDGSARTPISLQRYLRVEYKFRRSAPFASDEADVPPNGQRMRISGEVAWDTDQEGWYEIHPGGRGDLEWLPLSPKLTNLKSSYSEIVGPPEAGVIHWPGCNVKDTPKEFGPRDFKYEKRLVNQFYEIVAEVDNLTSSTVMQWSAGGRMLSPGDGNFQSNNVSVSYRLEGMSLKLWNRPEGGVTAFNVSFHLEDDYYPATRTVPILFDGIRINYEPDYYRTVGGCSVARLLRQQRLKTIPLAVPHYDPASLVELDHEVLVGLVGEIAQAHGLSSSLKQAAQTSDKADVVRTLMVLTVRYPETAGKIIPGRIN